MASKWEYLCAEVAIVTGFTMEYKVKAVNMEDVAEWKKGLALHEHFNQLGEQGWELVSAPHSGIGIAWFKRPR